MSTWAHAGGTACQCIAPSATDDIPRTGATIGCRFESSDRVHLRNAEPLHHQLKDCNMPATSSRDLIDGFTIPTAEDNLAADQATKASAGRPDPISFQRVPASAANGIMRVTRKHSEPLRRIDFYAPEADATRLITFCNDRGISYANALKILLDVFDSVSRGQT